MIEHVSDTALWMAALRANESDRPDALFRDPFASRLAGDRGKEIAASSPSAEQMAFAIAVRTVAIDRLIERAVARGAETILNLGAGLDTRPYRMKLPQTLRWIEIDFGPLLEYKRERLGSATPICRLERIPADLTQASDLLARLAAESPAAVVVTEGVVAYLSNDQASRLSRDLQGFRGWIQDYRRGRLNRRAEQKLGAPFRFDVDDPFAFFAEGGWKVEEDLRMLDVAEQVGRTAPLPFPWNAVRAVMPNLVKRLGNRTYGYAMLGR